LFAEVEYPNSCQEGHLTRVGLSVSKGGGEDSGAVARQPDVTS